MKRAWITIKKKYLIRIVTVILCCSMVGLNGCQFTKNVSEDLDMSVLKKSEGVLYSNSTTSKEMKYQNFLMNEDFGHWAVDGTKLTAVAVGNGGQHDRQAGGIGAVTTMSMPNEKMIDYSVEISKTKAMTDVYGILFRARTAQDCFQFSRYGNSVFLIRFKNGEMEFLERIIAGNASPQETLKIEVQGNKFKGYYNGELMLDMEFGEGDMNSYGNFGFHTNHNSAEFNHIKVNIKKSEKADTDQSNVEITNVSLSKNEVGRQMLTVKVKGKQQGADIQGVSCSVDGLVPEENYGGISATKGGQYKNVTVSADVDATAKSAGLILRADGIDGKNGYLVFARSYDNAVLYHIKGQKSTIVKYTMIPEKVEVSQIKAKISGNTLYGYINGIQVIKHKFAKGEINQQGDIGIITDIQNTVFKNLTANKKTADLKQSIGEFAKKNQSYELKTIAENAGLRRFGIAKENIPIDPCSFVSEQSGEYVYETPFYCLYEGDVRFTIKARDDFGRYSQKIEDFKLTAPESTYHVVDEDKFFDNLEPHAVWRASVTKDNHGKNTVSFPNYVWRINWGPEGISLVPKTINEQKDAIGRQIINGSPINVSVKAYDEGGTEVKVNQVRRYYEGNTSVYGLKPTYELETDKGRFIISVLIFNGDPIIRFESRFIANQDCKLTVVFGTNGATTNPQFVSPSGKFDVNNYYAAWHAQSGNRGCLYMMSYSKKPDSDSNLSNLKFSNVSGQKDREARLPLISFALVDADVPFADIKKDASYRELAKTMANTSFAVPDINAAMENKGIKDGNLFGLEYVRNYKLEENDYSIQDQGQFFAMPWCAENTLDSKAYNSYDKFHSAFGKRPYVVTKNKQILMNMPMPDLSADLLAKKYAPLEGAWYDNAKKDIEYFMTLQLADGSYDKYYRMDHYSLGRITLSMLLAYPGFSNDKAVQEKIAKQVRLSLSRMTGEIEYKNMSTSEIQKYYGEQYQYQTFEKGAVYKPFTYHPQWDFYTEMYGFVDMNLGHVHLFYSMLLYGKYVDPDYLRRVDVQEKIRQLIKFEWMNQEFNGDIYRVVIGGVNAAGSGDGYEEDLVLILPELAKMAGLHEDWYNMACRVATMKFGALKYFDYIDVENEWEFDFLTPIHNVDYWCPESGWNDTYYGDAWWMGPSVAGSVYGKWYYKNVFEYRPEVIKQMMYDLFEYQGDVLGKDSRHWLSTNMYVTENYMIDPFLGAVKLMNAYQRAKKTNGYLDKFTTGEVIWNFPFYACQMTLINDELKSRYDFMKGAVPVEDAMRLTASGVGYNLYAYAWKTNEGAVISGASYAVETDSVITVRPNPDVLGLSESGNWEVKDLATGKAITVKAGEKIDLKITPEKATTIIIKNA